MYLTGFADEAASDLDGQIRATKELGWKYIEARSVDGVAIHDVPESGMDSLCAALADAGVTVNCFGSTIANWGKLITAPFEETVEAVDRAIPRMQRLGTKLIRVMSYAVLPDKGPEDQMAEERFRRLREIVARFSAAGLVVVHENCANYGGLGWSYTQKLVENVPGLKLVFDTGNPVGSRDHTAGTPELPQSSWDFYQHVKEHIAYVHIKDGRFRAWNPDSIWSHVEYTYPGEGDGDVKRVVKDLLDSGYDGGFSMEPHMALAFHDPNSQAAADARYQNYVEYGRRFMRLLEEIGYAGRGG